MKILNIGSLNIDLVYQVPHFVRPGESLPALAFSRGPGGKGLNQSIAAARAGAAVRHAGCIGADGLFLRELLAAEGVDVAALRVGAEPTGHAIIQVNPEGENCIVLYHGANHALTADDLGAALAGFGPGDLLLAQNEVNDVGRLLRAGRDTGLGIIFNAAPASAELAALPLELTAVLVANETEGEALTGQTEPAAILAALRARCPQTEIVITLGAAGCRGAGPGGDWRLPAERVTPVDTTAAGDTFVGYLAAARAGGEPVRAAAELATRAAAIAVTRPGAATSIPRRAEIVAP